MSLQTVEVTQKRIYFLARILLSVEDDTVILGLEPFHSIVLGESVGETNAAGLALPVSDIHARAAEDNVEVHTIDTDMGIVLDSQIDVFLDTETKVSILREVLTTQLVFTDLKTTFKDLFGLGTTNSAVDSDLFVTSNTERSDCVPSLGKDGGLSSQRFQNLGSTSQIITRLADTNIQAQFADVQIPHDILGLG